MKTKILISLLFFSSVAFGQKLTFDGNFNNGDSTVGGKLTVSNPIPAGGELMTTNYAVTGLAVQYSVISNDHTGSFYPRSEREKKKNGPDSAIADDFFGFDVTFLNWPVDPRQGLITQSFTPAFPVFAVWFTTVSGAPWLQIVRQIDTTLIGTGTTGGPHFMQPKTNFTPIIPFVKYRLDFKRKWRADYTGEIEVWLNRTHFITYTGANTIRPYNPSVPKQPVDRIGIYWFGAKDNPSTPDVDESITPSILTRSAVFDNVSVGRASDMTWEQYLNYYSTVTTTGIRVPWRVN